MIQDTKFELKIRDVATHHKKKREKKNNRGGSQGLIIPKFQ